jgi:hypothetical protein
MILLPKTKTVLASATAFVIKQDGAVARAMPAQRRRKGRVPARSVNPWLNRAREVGDTVIRHENATLVAVDAA